MHMQNSQASSRASSSLGAFRFRRSMLALAIISPALATPWAAAAQPDVRGSLFSEAIAPSGVQPVIDETVLRSRPINVRRDLLDDATPGTAVAIDFFDDASFVAVFERHVVRAEDRYTWIGSVWDNLDQIGREPDTGAWFIMTVQHDVMVGNFWTADGRSFEVRPAGEGLNVYFAHETLQAMYPPCETCAEHAIAAGALRHRGAAERSGLATSMNADANASDREGDQPTPISSGWCDPDDGSMIDVMVLYTPAARNWAGGTSAIEALAHAAIDAANNAYNNSQINTQVRLVYLGETNYTESGSFGTDLSRLRAVNDGHMDEAHPLRNQYGADLVALLNNTSGSCGIAYLMTNLSTGFASNAFSVTRASCAVGNLTFAHELGHNMGSHHDRDNAGNALFPYSYGHRWTTTGGSLRRSVMAYAPGTRVPHFSNPDVLNGGVPTGIAYPHPQSADNALSINNASWTVANFREGICPAPENDHCQSVYVVAEGSHAFHNFDATTSGPVEGGGCNIGSDVWFGHTAQCDGELTVSLCGSSFDTVLAIYAFACPDSPGQFIACNSSFCGQQSQVTIPVTAGQGYRIRIGGLGGAQGDGTLTISCEPAICLGDITGSGEVDVSDLLALLAAWGPCLGCPADLTGDGVVDVSDLLELLANWGPCE